MDFSASIHRPLHIYLDERWYFITASTLKHTPYLSSPLHLNIWKEAFFALASGYNITICAWVVLENHYHILVRPHRGRDIGKFIGQLHGRTSRQINRLDGALGRQIWYSYWDVCIRAETDFWTRFNYIHFNPVKHRYVENPAEWEFSSYRFYQQQEGEDWLADCWTNYRVNPLSADDNF